MFLDLQQSCWDISLISNSSGQFVSQIMTCGMLIVGQMEVLWLLQSWLTETKFCLWVLQAVAIEYRSETIASDTGVEEILTVSGSYLLLSCSIWVLQLMNSAMPEASPVCYKLNLSGACISFCFFVFWKRQPHLCFIAEELELFMDTSPDSSLGPWSSLKVQYVYAPFS